MYKKYKPDRALTEAFHRLSAGEESPCQEEHRYSDSFTEKLNVLLDQTNKKGGKTMRFKKLTASLAAAALLILSAAGAYAMIPEIREKINLLFLSEDNAVVSPEVPEGYIGIFTAEDLDNVRNNLSENYILMNDIAFTEEHYAEGGAFEGGFVPIGNSETPFRGLFNGNGYVISNLQICVTDGSAAGLFGYAESNYELYPHNNPEDELDVRTESTGGIIKNLGIEDSRITLAVPGSVTANTGKWAQIYAGAVAGNAKYVAGCYVKNTEVFLTLAAHSTRSVYMGGVAGHTDITDSCWTDAAVVFRSEAPTAIPEEYIHIAGVTGSSLACVTSYFSGTVDAGDYPDGGVSFCNPTEPPELITEPVLREIYLHYFDSKGIPYDSGMTLEEAIAFKTEKAAENPDAFRILSNILSFYAKAMYNDYRTYITYDDYLTGDNAYEFVYILDPLTTPRERRAMSSQLSEFFPDEEFYRICRENGMKYGIYGCYDLRKTPDADFSAFDTEHIWYIGDGLPVLRLFRFREDGTVPPSDNSAGDAGLNNRAEYWEEMNRIVRN